MTTGERLVDISTLISDTAMNHFLNIDTGSSTTIFGKVVEVGIDTPPALEVDTPTDVVIELETAPTIDVELESTTPTIELEEQELNIDKSCPQP